MATPHLNASHWRKSSQVGAQLYTRALLHARVHTCPVQRAWLPHRQLLAQTCRTS